MTQYLGAVVHANHRKAGSIELHISGYGSALIEADALIGIPMIDGALVPYAIERWPVFGCRGPEVHVLAKYLFLLETIASSFREQI